MELDFLQSRIVLGHESEDEDGYGHENMHLWDPSIPRSRILMAERYKALGGETLAAGLSSDDINFGEGEAHRANSITRKVFFWSLGVSVWMVLGQNHLDALSVL